jgi:hypothetical protein
MPTLKRSGCSSLHLPMRKHVNPLGGKTTDWRAGCGRTACPVRREGESKPIGSSYPYNLIERIDSTVATRRNVCAHLTVH